MSKPATAVLFLDNVEKSGLLDPRTLGDVRRRCDQSELPEQPEDLAATLIRDGQLTEFQAKQLLAGKNQGFIIGGRYKVLDRLGIGGMGAVFLCEHTVMRHKVALKVLPRDQAFDPVALERFRREARAVATLNHPNIIRAFDISEDSGLHYLVLEYVDGMTLHELVRREGPQDIGRAAEYIRQAALGLQHAFEANLVHRDIKPGNILLDRAGVVKVLDLGLARFFLDKGDNLTTEHDAQVILGTADYISPEQAVDSHDVDIRSDIYSLGATFYYLLAGQPPFPGNDVTQKLTQHQTRPPEPIRKLRPEVPAELAAILEKMMAKKPARRFQVPQDLVVALTPWARPGTAPDTLPTGPDQAEQDSRTEGGFGLGGSPTATNPLAGIDRAPPMPASALARQAARHRQQTRKRQLALVAAALTLLGGAALAWVLVHPPQKPIGTAAPEPSFALVAAPVPTGSPISAEEAEFIRRVASLPAEEQTKAVLERLQRLNPDFDGLSRWGTPVIDNGKVVTLTFASDHVTDLRPLRALVHLRNLACVGSRAEQGQLENLEPLRGLPLVSVNFNANPRLRDFSALKAMPLAYVTLPYTRLDSLEFLRGMPIKKLHVANTRVSDLSVVAELPLEELVIANTRVTDLGPLRKLPLKSLDCTGTQIADYSPLEGLPLTRLSFDFDPAQNVAWLRTLRGLESVNKVSPAEFWKNVP